ncbi:MAG TPA: hypothetical protein VH186_25300 [Chloroflexia bacterium]|nr:hypothetical protein [Chloroflexia bacterium]
MKKEVLAKKNKVIDCGPERKRQSNTLHIQPSVTREVYPLRAIHPIDRRLAEMGKSRKWLAQAVGRSSQCIGLYCNYKLALSPNSYLTTKICQVLAVDLNYLVFGKRLR